MKTGAFTYSLAWKVTFSYENVEWVEIRGSWGDNCIKLKHVASGLVLMGETIENETAWIFGTDSLDAIVRAFPVVEMSANLHVSKSSGI